MNLDAQVPAHSRTKAPPRTGKHATIPPPPALDSRPSRDRSLGGDDNMSMTSSHRSGVPAPPPPPPVRPRGATTGSAPRQPSPAVNGTKKNAPSAVHQSAPIGITPGASGPTGQQGEEGSRHQKKVWKGGPTAEEVESQRMAIVCQMTRVLSRSARQQIYTRYWSKWFRLAKSRRKLKQLGLVLNKNMRLSLRSNCFRRWVLFTALFSRSPCGGIARLRNGRLTRDELLLMEYRSYGRQRDSPQHQKFNVVSPERSVGRALPSWSSSSRPSTPPRYGTPITRKEEPEEVYEVVVDLGSDDVLQCRAAPTFSASVHQQRPGLGTETKRVLHRDPLLYTTGTGTPPQRRVDDVNPISTLSYSSSALSPSRSTRTPNQQQYAADRLSSGDYGHQRYPYQW